MECHFHSRFAYLNKFERLRNIDCGERISDSYIGRAGEANDISDRCAFDRLFAETVELIQRYYLCLCGSFIRVVIYDHYILTDLYASALYSSDSYSSDVIVVIN